MDVAQVALQLCDAHTGQRNSVMSIDHDHRARLGVMRLTENLRRCRVRKQGVLKRKYVLVHVEVRNGFLAEVRIEHEGLMPMNGGRSTQHVQDALA